MREHEPKKEPRSGNQSVLKRAGLLFLTLLAVLIWTACAAAEEHPVNPKQARVWEMERLTRPREPGGLVPRGGPVTLKCTVKPTLGGTGKWTVSYNTAAYGTVRDVVFYLEMKDWSNDYTTVYYVEKTGQQGTITSCRIVSGGSYRMVVLARFGSMTSYYYDEYYFTIQDDASHTSLTEKITQVINSCRSSTQWQTALNLHDWLVTHVYYDPNYEYYGADMILRGYGVCDGYSKAYYMLCRAAGITVSRVLGTAGGSHAWNAVKLDGKWYYVDPTWDDPGMGAPALSGSESHQYFCLNERIMSLDHTNDKSVFRENCTSLDDNYYIHTGEWAGWGGGYSYDSGSYRVVTYTEQIQNALNSGELSCTLDQDTVWVPEGYGNGGLWMKLIAAYGLERTRFTLADGGAVRVRTSAGASGWPLTVRVSGWAIQETGTLVLPAKTVTVEANAFEKCASTTVRIQGKCSAIGDKAFADSAVRTVYVPDSVREIAEDAFSGCARIIFITKNQTAAAYASSHGFLVLAP